MSVLVSTHICIQAAVDFEVGACEGHLQQGRAGDGRVAGVCVLSRPVLPGPLSHATVQYCHKQRVTQYTPHVSLVGGLTVLISGSL